MLDGTLDIEALSTRVRTSLSDIGSPVLRDLAADPTRLADQDYWSHWADAGHCLAAQVKGLASGLITESDDLPKAQPSVYLIVVSTGDEVSSLYR